MTSQDFLYGTALFLLTCVLLGPNYPLLWRFHGPLRLFTYILALLTKRLPPPPQWKLWDIFVQIPQNYHNFQFITISLSFNIFEYLYLLAVLVNIQNCIIHNILKVTTNFYSWHYTFSLKMGQILKISILKVKSHSCFSEY